MRVVSQALVAYLQLVNWLGRVDMIGASTYRLYYGEDYLDGPTWVAVGDEKFTLTPFTREFFEAAMVELFS